MARSRLDTPVKQSLLDRLTDRADWPTTHAASLNLYREGLRRDVEWLLNTRQAQTGACDDLPEAARSVLHYGLPDLSWMSGKRDNAETLKATLLSTLRRYEPRIHDPEVTLLPGEHTARRLRFQVRGTLRLETGEENVTFDTNFEISTGEYVVR